MRKQPWCLLPVLFFLVVLIPTTASSQYEGCLENGGSELCVPLSVTAWCYGGADSSFNFAPPLRTIRDGVYEPCYLSEDEALEAWKTRWPQSRIIGVATDLAQ
jgi:hypothetical protein